VSQLLDVARAASLEVVDSETDGSRAVVAAHLAGELPLVLSHLLPELQPTRELRGAARLALGEGLLSLTDGEGMVAAEFLPHLPLLAACWTRCRMVGQYFKKNCWSSSAEAQYEWLVRQLLRLTLSDGRMLLAPGDPSQWCTGVIANAVALAGDASDRAAAAIRFDPEKLNLRGRARGAGLPDASVNSDWAGVAVLGESWEPNAPLVGVTYRGTSMRLEVAVGGRPLLSGQWISHWSAAGVPACAVGHWEEQCWFSDRDIDYLDVAITLAGGHRLERQIALIKQDRALLLHEVLLTAHDQPVPLTCEMHVPLAAALRLEPQPETRDATIIDRKGRVRAAVLPLSLAEWRADSRPGDLSEVGQFIELSQQRLARRMSVPLWLDLDAARARHERTWRQLTVAQQLARQPHDVAVGYRVQSGSDQWLVYRSLAPAANRTVLGQNLASECFVARFKQTGEAEELIEIETGDE
jgi:hypothetical protein